MRNSKSRKEIAMRYVFLILLLIAGGISLQGCAAAPREGGGYNNDYGGGAD